MTIFERLRRVRVLRALYRLPWAPRMYHFALAFLGALLYGFPSRRLRVIGITGTKGKTTTLELLREMFEAAGEPLAVLSSIRVKVRDGEGKNLSKNTMPGRFFIQAFLRRAVRAGCRTALVEVTSEGMVLSRHRFIRWSAGLITNIAPEHIESHGSFEKYRDAKLAFLKAAARSGRACPNRLGSRGGRVFVNGDDAPSSYFSEHLPPESVEMYRTDTLPELPETLKQALPGEFNRQNVAAAVSVARSFGVGEEEVSRGLSSFRGVPGRMSFVQERPFAVVVDYAHTPDSLKAVYTTLRDAKVWKRLICVLGSCGGGRDKWKRPVMGGIAAELCDEIVLTNEDPFDEPPEAVLDQIASGIPAGTSYKKIVDRREAIRYAISLAKDGDCAVMTGKGSESSIRVAGGEEIPWNEHQVAEEVLRELGKTLG